MGFRPKSVSKKSSRTWTATTPAAPRSSTPSSRPASPGPSARSAASPPAEAATASSRRSCGRAMRTVEGKGWKMLEDAAKTAGFLWTFFTFIQNRFRWTSQLVSQFFTFWQKDIFSWPFEDDFQAFQFLLCILTQSFKLSLICSGSWCGWACEIVKETILLKGMETLLDWWRINYWNGLAVAVEELLEPSGTHGKFSWHSVHDKDRYTDVASTDLGSPFISFTLWLCQNSYWK